MAGGKLLEAISEYCLSCCDGDPDEVSQCPGVECPLYEYRGGHRPKPGPARRTALKAMRCKCIDCCCRDYKLIRSCDGHEEIHGRVCPLHRFRFGKLPDDMKRKISDKVRAIRSEKMTVVWKERASATK